MMSKLFFLVTLTFSIGAFSDSGLDFCLQTTEDLKATYLKKRLCRQAENPVRSATCFSYLKKSYPGLFNNDAVDLCTTTDIFNSMVCFQAAKRQYYGWYNSNLVELCSGPNPLDTFECSKHQPKHQLIGKTLRICRELTDTPASI